MRAYRDFLESKRKSWDGNGEHGVDLFLLPSQLYPWQRAVAAWAARKGRACIFADCGLGKTLMQLGWAQTVPGKVLILAPLCVGEQTAEEARRVGIDAAYVSSQADVGSRHISITNYERLHRMDLGQFSGVVLDESSILKSFDGKTRTALIETCQPVPYRLCCTATPSPNDISELANHAEFLGLMTRAEFLATWFVHDDVGWRMKRHAVRPFYEWMASWAVAFRHPRDLGYEDERFDLPGLEIIDHLVDIGRPIGGALFPELGLKGIQGRLAVRQDTVAERVETTAALVDDGESWIVWCGLNTEADAAVRAIPGAVQVAGKDAYQDKRAAVQGFIDGRIRVLVSKPKILGFGMNFQHCHSMAFLGLSDSYETYYQCIRRCFRFGQASTVSAHIVISDAERGIVSNVRRKESDATKMAGDLLVHLPNEVAA